MHKVWSRSFEEYDHSVNKVVMEHRKNGSNLEFWPILGETLIIRGELVRKCVHLRVASAVCKLICYSL